MPSEVKVTTEKLFDRCNSETPWGWKINVAVVGDKLADTDLKSFLEKQSIYTDAYFAYPTRKEAEEQLQVGITIVKNAVALWCDRREETLLWTGIEEVLCRATPPLIFSR